MRRLAIAFVTIMLFSGIASAADRPQCLDSNGIWIYTGPAVCFIENAGQPGGIGAGGADGLLLANFVSRHDWARFGPDAKGIYHASDVDAQLTFIPPSACDENWVNCDPNKFYLGTGKVSLLGPMQWPPCPLAANITGNVTSPSGDLFKVLYLEQLVKDKTSDWGCRVVQQTLSLTPR